ncbi:mitochondrial carrier domain-containing protein [Bisporella sp. PMI_857]|nr:mitochondrial carrier domain-containing protein [Bisporella sp. PMI_857]
MRRKMLLTEKFSSGGFIKDGAFFTTYEAVISSLSKANSTLSRSTSPLIPRPSVNSVASGTAEYVLFSILHMRFKKLTQLFRGYTALAARNLPFTAMQFPMFEHTKESIKQYRKQKGISRGSLTETDVITAVTAGGTGSIAAVLTTPVDVVKTRIMLSAAGEGFSTRAQQEVEKAQREGRPLKRLASEKAGTRKRGLIVAREILQECGIKGLFRGAILRALWTALGSGLYLSVYESGRFWLRNRHEDQSHR